MKKRRANFSAFHYRNVLVFRFFLAANVKERACLIVSHPASSTPRDSIKPICLLSRERERNNEIKSVCRGLEVASRWRPAERAKIIEPTTDNSTTTTLSGIKFTFPPFLRLSRASTWKQKERKNGEEESRLSNPFSRFLFIQRPLPSLLSSLFSRNTPGNPVFRGEIIKGMGSKGEVDEVAREFHDPRRWQSRFRGRLRGTCFSYEVWSTRIRGANWIRTSWIMEFGQVSNGEGGNSLVEIPWCLSRVFGLFLGRLFTRRNWRNVSLSPSLSLLFALFLIKFNKS